MELFETISNRSSVRKYKAEQPSKELLMQVVEAARIAPSACNNQPWKFYVVMTDGVLRQLASAYDRSWFAQAPAVIVVAGDHKQSWHRASDNKDHCDVDAAIAAEHIALAATALGLGTCWVCNFDVEKVSRALNLGEGWEPIAMLPIGYPDTDHVAPKRKAAEEVIEII